MLKTYPALRASQDCNMLRPKVIMSILLNTSHESDAASPGLHNLRTEYTY
jgi:hypothetical protein